MEDAATKALKRIHTSGVLDRAPRLDKDTKDIAGMPDIANTILDKISASSAILADLSFIGKDSLRPENEQKLLPNPNVLLELGYAIAHLGWERVICVMNTHYGEKEDLPFDLRHRRWPLSYCLPPDADQETLKTVKQQLSKDLEDAIKAQARGVLQQFTTARQMSLRDLQVDIPELSDEAKQLLVNAAQDPNGDILKVRTFGGLTIQTNGKNLAQGADARSQAIWEGALEELVDTDMVTSKGYKGELFSVTRRGYEVADILNSVQ